MCLFLEHVSATDEAPTGNDLTKTQEAVADGVMVVGGQNGGLGVDSQPSHAYALEHSSSAQSSNEIIPVSESTDEKFSDKYRGQSKRSLAECISTAEDEEWSALEGVTRVNSLLSLPRFLSSDKGSASWRKWI